MRNRGASLYLLSGQGCTLLLAIFGAFVHRGETSAFSPGPIYLPRLRRTKIPNEKNCEIIVKTYSKPGSHFLSSRMRVNSIKQLQTQEIQNCAFCHDCTILISIQPSADSGVRSFTLKVIFRQSTRSNDYRLRSMKESLKPE